LRVSAWLRRKSAEEAGDNSQSAKLAQSLLQRDVCFLHDPREFSGGSGEIRTHEPLAGLLVFKTSALNRSATLPFAGAALRLYGPAAPLKAAGRAQAGRNSSIVIRSAGDLFTLDHE
jgi:hypothetical protein